MSKENKKKNVAKNSVDEKRGKLIKSTVTALIFFILGAIALLSSFHAGGQVGESIFGALKLVLGWVAYIVFLGFFWVAYNFWTDRNDSRPDFVSILALLLIIFSITTFTASLGLENSGVVGNYLAEFLKSNFGNILPAILSFALGLIAFVILYQDKPSLKLRNKNTGIETQTENTSSNEKAPTLSLDYSSNPLEEKKVERKNIWKPIWSAIKTFFKKLISFLVYIFSFRWLTDEIAKQKAQRKTLEDLEKADSEIYKVSDLHLEMMNNFENSKEEELHHIDDTETPHFENENAELQKVKQKSGEERRQSILEESKPVFIEETFEMPDLSLLNPDQGKSSAGDSKFKMNIIQKVLNQFNIPVEMGEVTVGPSVTQFTLKPAQGVNVRKILGLKDNLQMALSATNMHIEAPIPGKPFVGIGIPNEKKTLLGLRSLLELDEFQDAPPLALAIGKNIIGKPVISDLSKMPHLLVAGATGTGKSVTLHNLIISLLYKNSPHDLKLIILDPKRVEFTAYNSLPHLYTPIIKDAKTAIKSLSWAAQEMDRRYDVLGEYGMPNITEYNKKIFFPALEKAKKKSSEGEYVKGLPPKMPFVVIVFDEFNDFMLTYPKEITPVITSLTQKARAAGIHLILTTQRPDVKVITGTIKANIPSRIALKTTSQIDSRTILDQAGAEDLLGNGDMLYMNGSSITRVQAPFVSSEEIKSVIAYIKKQYEDFLPDSIDIQKVKISSSASAGYREMESSNERNPNEEPEDDEDYMSARDYVISTGKASTSALQTAFRWGYNKSARIMNDLEAYGIIGPAVSGRHREVLFGKNTESEVEKLERELEELEDGDTEENEEE
ncbi:hypothetical protein SDC9_07940 [bioreactor metagenome]|uniref:FtsK domain-containing protein n=1 Tax=bioreactor metagenome TaxID=1076179 RepID=A0A644T5V9_9ZZZZ|nr:DNA translocase FtsK [Candidatus Elulimicrobiales bacterium]